MPFRSRNQKRYLFGVICIAAVLLIINTQLQITAIHRYYTIELSRTIVPHTLISADNSTKNMALKDVRRDDEGVINQIKGLFEYRSDGSDYNLTNYRLGDRSRGQASQLDVYLKYKVYGYFVEIGAGDGESESISLMLERERQWKGLLIEPDPVKYRALVGKRRKAVLLNACVETNDTETWIEYATDSAPQRVPCFWIEPILRANSIDTIDVLTIKANGKEESILKKFPFEKVHVTIVTVEHKGIVDLSDSLSSVMSDKGFRSVKLMSNHVLDKTDIIFINQLDNIQSVH